VCIILFSGYDDTYICYRMSHNVVFGFLINMMHIVLKFLENIFFENLLPNFLNF